MTKVLMVCLGNICRSPLAEGILKSKTDSNFVFVDSAGTGGYHIGNPPNDVWEYLMAVPSPWAGRNDAIVTMYRNAQSGECPLVIDKSTPSCGGGRFGCWTCTVVQKDRSMEAMIDNDLSF